MTKLLEFFCVRSTDDSHAMDRISVAADDLEAAEVEAKSLSEALVMPQVGGRRTHRGARNSVERCEQFYTDAHRSASAPFPNQATTSR